MVAGKCMTASLNALSGLWTLVRQGKDDGSRAAAEFTGPATGRSPWFLEMAPTDGSLPSYACSSHNPSRLWFCSILLRAARPTLLASPGLCCLQPVNAEETNIERAFIEYLLNVCVKKRGNKYRHEGRQ